MPKKQKQHGWQSKGVVTIAAPVLTEVEVVPPADERRVSSWESVRAYVPERDPGTRKNEMHDTRMRRLARRRAKCPVCKAATGERCYDLFALPTKVHIKGFHAKRKMLKPGPVAVTRMERLPKRDAECAGKNCPHTSFDHKARLGACTKCRCRSFKR